MKTNKVTANYGVKGWMLILFGIVINCFTQGLWPSSGVNTYVPLMSTGMGVETVVLMNGITLGSLITIPFAILAGSMFMKFGSRKMTSLALAVLGVSLCFFGRISGYAGFVVLFTIIALMCTMLQGTAIPQIYSKYFPTKKGLALGLATIGMSMTAFIALPILTFLMQSKGIPFTFTCFGVFTAALGVVNYILIPETPQEMGMFPDNGDVLPTEVKALQEDAAYNQVPWTLKEGVKNKNFWLLPAAYGIIFLITSGTTMSMVRFEMENGANLAAAIGFMSLSAIFGIIGSSLSGWMDQKIGVRKTSLVYCLLCVASCAVSGILPYNGFTNILFLFLYGMYMGSVSNLPQSHAMSVFKPRSYAKMWTFMMPLMLAIRAFGASLVGNFQVLTGSIKGAYLCFSILAVVAFVCILFSNESLAKKPGEKPTVVR